MVAPPQGLNPNAIYKGPTPQLTAAEMTSLHDKEARYAAWLSAQQFIHHPYSVTPYCIINPSGGCSALLWEVSGGGEYVQEPWNQPNWCAPGAATAVELHWNYNVVMNASPSDGYTGGQAWMDFFALHYGFWYGSTYRYGVMDGQGANEWVVKTALNAYNNNTYYNIVNTSSTSDLVGKTKYDISVDGRPVDYFANAQYLPEWHVSYQINHSIEVYALDQKGNYAQYNVDQI